MPANHLPDDIVMAAVPRCKPANLYLRCGPVAVIRARNAFDLHSLCLVHVAVLGDLLVALLASATKMGARAGTVSAVHYPKHRGAKQA
jgi:hypothetical protein